MNDILPPSESERQRLTAASDDKHAAHARHALTLNEFGADRPTLGLGSTPKLPFSGPPGLFERNLTTAFTDRGTASGLGFSSPLETCGNAVQTKPGFRMDCKQSAVTFVPIKSTPNLWGTHNA